MGICIRQYICYISLRHFYVCLLLFEREYKLKQQKGRKKGSSAWKNRLSDKKKKIYTLCSYEESPKQSFPFHAENNTTISQASSLSAWQWQVPTPSLLPSTKNTAPSTIISSFYIYLNINTYLWKYHLYLRICNMLCKYEYVAGGLRREN